MDPSFLGRYLNDGFSGGEKKRLEMLQMAVLGPKYAVLDETDSGLDVDALSAVGESVKAMREDPRAADRLPDHHALPAHSAAHHGRRRPHHDGRPHRQRRRPRTRASHRARRLRSDSRGDRRTCLTCLRRRRSRASTPSCSLRERAARAFEAFAATRYGPREAQPVLENRPGTLDSQRLQIVAGIERAHDLGRDRTRRHRLRPRHRQARSRRDLLSARSDARSAPNPRSSRS